MRTLILAALASVLWLSGASSASAQGYIGIMGGVNIVQDTEIAGIDLDFDEGGAFSLVGGYQVSSNFRVEGELAGRSNDLSDFSGAVTSGAFLLNGFFDIPTGSGITPYFGGGVGVANVELDSGDDDDDTVAAFQLGAGIGFDVSQNLILSLDYRFFATEDPEFFGAEYEYRNHTVLAGLRYKF